MQRSGELIFPDNQRLVAENRCNTSVDLLDLLSNHYQRHTSKQVWGILQQEALGAMGRLRVAKPKVKATVKQLIKDKRHNSQAVFGTVAERASDGEDLPVI